MAWKEIIPYREQNGHAIYLLSNRNDLTGIAEEYERIRAEEWAREDAERKRRGNHEHES